ncbi:DUF3179 domain-containing protein [Halosolutus halophilus]|uniref:DUF3179 domain-containing protein n=1 Tax=Halosolutus halophilus TaxID=1552990 RepID=UPI002234F25D|nr:DUF3179 domain-containing protein [Halosolutus halophilus]
MGDGRIPGGISRRHCIDSTGGVGLAALAGCLDSSGAFDRGASDVNGSTGGPPTADRSLPEEYTTRELDEASLSGGPGQDGIPSIDDPQFTSADDPPTNLADGDPVFGVVLNGEAKAYPQYILVWHEVVNDVGGGESIAVTYCPLTGTAQGFSRGESDGGTKRRSRDPVAIGRAPVRQWGRPVTPSDPAPATSPLPLVQEPGAEMATAGPPVIASESEEGPFRWVPSRSSATASAVRARLETSAVAGPRAGRRAAIGLATLVPDRTTVLYRADGVRKRRTCRQIETRTTTPTVPRPGEFPRRGPRKRSPARRRRRNARPRPTRTDCSRVSGARGQPSRP